VTEAELVGQLLLWVLALGLSISFLAILVAFRVLLDDVARRRD